MRKQNTKKEFPKAEEESQTDGNVTIYEDAEEAAEAVTSEAEGLNVMPTAIMVTTKEGYVSGDGTFYGAGGISAGNPQVNDADPKEKQDKDITPDAFGVKLADGPDEDEKPAPVKKADAKADSDKD